jgi:hypothetical protein
VSASGTWWSTRGKKRRGSCAITRRRWATKQRDTRTSPAVRSTRHDRRMAFGNPRLRVAADPGAEDGSYPELKRGEEIAVEHVFSDRALIARAGTILGPYENVGRLTWWLARMARGGEILCPGPAELEIQYVDARDLAGFVIDASSTGHSGAFNVVSRRGHATMGSLLDACHDAAGADDAVMTCVDPDAIAAAGIESWSELPVWIPPGHEYSAMHDANVDRAHSAGLHCRPVKETVLDTWRWFSALNAAPPVRAGLPAPGLDPGREREALLTWARSKRLGLGPGLQLRLKAVSAGNADCDELSWPARRASYRHRPALWSELVAGFGSSSRLAGGVRARQDCPMFVIAVVFSAPQEQLNHHRIGSGAPAAHS